jgi:hypothetical protein
MRIRVEPQAGPLAGPLREIVAEALLLEQPSDLGGQRTGRLIPGGQARETVLERITAPPVRGSDYRGTRYLCLE